MAQIPRPPKEGNVTSYVAKVAAGYTKILAGEVDADFDTIYDAWNSGTDTANLRDGCVTSAKLAPDAVGPRELADSGVQTPAIQNGAVTDIKIATVSWSKVTGVPNFVLVGTAAGGDLVGTYPNPTIRPGAVTGAAIPPNSVNGAQMVAATVTAREIAPATITYDKIVPTNSLCAPMGVISNAGPGGTLTIPFSDVVLQTLSYTPKHGYMIVNGVVQGTYPATFASGTVNALLTAKLMAGAGMLGQSQLPVYGAGGSPGVVVPFTILVTANAILAVNSPATFTLTLTATGGNAVQVNWATLTYLEPA